MQWLSRGRRVVHAAAHDDLYAAEDEDADMTIMEVMTITNRRKRNQ